MAFPVRTENRERSFNLSLTYQPAGKGEHGRDAQQCYMKNPKLLVFRPDGKMGKRTQTQLSRTPHQGNMSRT